MAICDCEKSHNGLGMAGRECDCEAICGLSRVDERADVLGGDAVFRETRLSVLHIGKMVEAGERVDDILEDYPYLNEDHVKFASFYSSLCRKLT